MILRAILIGLLYIFWSSSLKAQISVLPDNDEILYSGRISFADPLNPTFSMSASGFVVNFEGTCITGRFSTEDGNSYLYVIVDGKVDPKNRHVIEVNSLNEDSYILAENLKSGPHSIEIIKLNESDTKVTFHGIVFTGDKLLRKRKREELKLEFVGDSNTAGWSAWDAYDKGGNEKSGAYFTFPGLTAEMLDAEYSLIGGSSSGVTDKAYWNLTKAFDRIHLKDEDSELNLWNFKENYWKFKPHAVIVNLGANDYYGQATKSEIIDGWKTLIEDKIRIYYPETHVVLVNSYGWAYNEPADYVHELVSYFNQKGDENISYVLFPWLWGQTHAVVNEHAGFANILATHLAEQLDLPKPKLSKISSFMDYGEIYNGSFEKSLIDEVADGWRPHGECTIISDKRLAYEGNNFVRLKDEGWLNYPARVEKGMKISLSGAVRSDHHSNHGYLKIVFKDQAQKTIQSKQVQFDAKTDWSKHELVAEVPDNVWSAWVVVESGKNSEVDFDDVKMSIVGAQ